MVKWFSQTLGGKKGVALEGVEIDEKSLLMTIEDIYENEVFRMSVSQVGTPVWVIQHTDHGEDLDAVRGANATIVSEDFHGEVTVQYLDDPWKGEQEHHVKKSRLRPVREEQVRMHRKAVQKICPELFRATPRKRHTVFSPRQSTVKPRSERRKSLNGSETNVGIIDESTLETHTRFYLMNRGTNTEPEITLIDQAAMTLAFQTLAPTLNTKVLFHRVATRRP